MFATVMCGREREHVCKSGVCLEVCVCVVCVLSECCVSVVSVLCLCCVRENDVCNSDGFERE